MIGWHHQFNGPELGQTPGYREAQGSLVCCSPWVCKELDTTWRLNNNSKMSPVPCLCAQCHARHPRLKSPTLLLEPSSSPLIPVPGGQPPPLFYNHKAHVISVRLTHFKTHPQSWMPQGFDSGCKSPTSRKVS